MLRETQQPRYWQEDFVVTDKDVEHLYGFILDKGVPCSLKELALALIKRRCQEEEKRIRAAWNKGIVFRPQRDYSVGDKVLFPALGLVVGTVVGERPGYNPGYGEFKVIQVRLEDTGEVREFASSLPRPHKLDTIPDKKWIKGLNTLGPRQIYKAYGSGVEEKLAARLASDKDSEFVSFRHLWFLKGLMAPIHEGHLNIAEAMIEVHRMAFPTDALLKEMELPAEIPHAVQAFSLNWALGRDERFDEVGTETQPRWYLRRLEPPEVFSPPARLQVAPTDPYDRKVMDDELLKLEGEIEDEATDPAVFPPPFPKKLALVLTYPHRRAGTLPLTPRVKTLFPLKPANGHVMISLVDGSNGERIPAWIVSREGYICGLQEWYEKHGLPAGAYILLEATKDPFTAIIDFKRRRPKKEWVRVAKVVGSRLTFEIQMRSYQCEYDELMIIDEEEREKIDALWQQIQEGDKPLAELICELFPELAKLSPQGAVHAKTLYSAVNLVRRTPPGPIFAILSTQERFVSLGNGYWAYKG